MIDCAIRHTAPPSGKRRAAHHQPLNRFYMQNHRGIVLLRDPEPLLVQQYPEIHQLIPIGHLHSAVHRIEHIRVQALQL